LEASHEGILSDLHLSDGKERDDFQYQSEFDELVRKLSEEFRHIEMVFLGDIFDLIRTQKYYESERQALTEENLKEIKRKVMAEILVKHAAFFEPLETSLEKPGHTLRLIRKEKEVG